MSRDVPKCPDRDILYYKMSRAPSILEGKWRPCIHTLHILIISERRSCSQSNPIAPPKRRKLSLNDEDHRMTTCNLLGISLNDIIPRSASTSDIKSPLLNLDPVWDSAFADKTEEFFPQQPKDANGSNHLTHSLRKIAKRNELEN